MGTFNFSWGRNHNKIVDLYTKKILKCQENFLLPNYFNFLQL
jgi:hypothetical protein